MNIGNRIISVIAGLGVAWCAVWGASVMHSSCYTPDYGLFVFWVLVCLSIIAIAMGIVCSMHQKDKAASASVIGVCAAFVFGAIAAPLTANGAWVTPWDFLLIIGFLPMVFVVKNLLGDTYVATKNFFHNMH